MLPQLMNVEVKAGSAGKPNTSARQQAWAALMPVISQAIAEIGALRGSTPAEIADCKEELVIETINRTGERVDAERFCRSAGARRATAAAAARRSRWRTRPSPANRSMRCYSHRPGGVLPLQSAAPCCRRATRKSIRP
jgi:hypothetical protein